VVGWLVTHNAEALEFILKIHSPHRDNRLPVLSSTDSPPNLSFNGGLSCFSDEFDPQEVQ
jgi:hypothetical protein